MSKLFNMKRIKLNHGSARVSKNISSKTKKALNNLLELAYKQAQNNSNAQ